MEWGQGVAIKFTSASSFWLPERTSVGSGWAEHGPFAFWLIDALRPKVLVELGTHHGYSFAAFCQAVKKLKLDTVCYAIDTWRGDEHAGHYNDDVFNDVKSYVDAKYAGFAHLIRLTFDEGLSQFEDGSIDLLHIDGRHYFQDVVHDFESWIPKLKPNAVVLFHDTNVYERNFGVHRLWKTLSEKHSHFEFLHGHGLGILGRGNDFPPLVAELFAAAKSPELTEQTRTAYGRLGSAVADHFRAEVLEDTLKKTVSDAADTLKQTVGEAEDILRETLSDAETEKKRLQELLQEALARESRRDAKVSRQIGDLQRQVEEAERTIAAILSSTTWRVAQVATGVTRRFPGLNKGLRVGLRGGLKLVQLWRERRLGRIGSFVFRRSTVFLRKLARVLPRNLQAALINSLNLKPAAALPEPAVATPQTVDRFSLTNIPPLTEDFSAAADWYDLINPEVSIVILNWNRSAMTLLCLQHLWERTSGHRYEIIVVDNGSHNADIEFLEQNARATRIIRLGKNSYFGEANNIGAEAAGGKYICFLNNDAFVHEAWLNPLVTILSSSPNIGAVGPRFLYPGGKLQEAGALIDKDGHVTQVGKGYDGLGSLHRDQRTVDYVSAACVLVRKSDFLKVLGFDLTWEPAYYEDVDLCLKLRLAGLNTVYCPTSVVTHIENATSADNGNGLNLSTIVDINRIKFVDRWGSYLEDAQSDGPALIIELPKKLVTNDRLPDVLIFTPYDLTPGGGERFILTIAESFRGIANVRLITKSRLSRSRILTMGRELGLQLDHVREQTLAELYDRALSSKPAQLAFILGNEIFPQLGRLAVRNIFICQFPFPIADPRQAEATRPFWKQLDLVVTYSFFVARHVERLVYQLDLSPVPVEVLYPPVPLHQAGVKKPAQILHVGRFFTGGHCKRQDVLIEAFREVLKGCPGAELHLAGSIHPEAEHRDYYSKIVDLARGLPVFFHANCSPETLHTLYSESAIYWHATGYGEDVEAEPQKTEHFGISVVEAMSAGCIPMVPRAGGPAEIVQDGVTGFHFDSIEDLASRTQFLVLGPSETLETFSQAATKAAATYSDVCFRSKVRSIAQRFFDLDDCQQAPARAFSE